MGYQWDIDIVKQQNHLGVSENGVQTHEFMALWQSEGRR